MPRIPVFLLNALQFREPRREALRDASDSDWKTVLSGWSTARLAISLRQDCGDDLPDWVRSRIDAYLSDTALRFDRIKTVYSTVAKALRNADADHLVIKGFSLWPGYTEHPRFRPQGDIDLYCPPESIFNARDVLAELGYVPNLEDGHVANDDLCTMVPKNSWTLKGNVFDPEMPICFELHFCWWNESVMNFRPVGIEQFWSRRIERHLDGVLFRGLAPADNLAYTALNILRDRIRGVPAAEQVYGLARFLHTHSADRAFWATWRDLHDEPLRRMETVSFRLAAELFACSLPEEVHEEIRRSPAAVQSWFREFSNPPLSERFDRKMDGIWLHLSFLDSSRDKLWVLLGRLLSIPAAVGKFRTVFGQDHRRVQGMPEGGRSHVLSFCRKSIKYAGWSAHRTTVRFATLPFLLWRGLRYWLPTKGLSSQFWTFLAASLCFDIGLGMFFFLYNLYLLDRGLKADFLGIMTSAMNIGSVACTIPAGVLVQRLGLRKSLLLCFVLVSFVSTARALFAPRSALLALAFLGGFVTTIWAVAISPAIARLTDERSRPFGFSVVFSFGIGAGILANQVASRIPGLLMRLNPVMTSLQAKQMALLISCGIVALGLFPLSRLQIAPIADAGKMLYLRNPFLWRFLPALALWSLVTGSFSPLANVYFSQHLRMPLEQIGLVFSFSSLFQVLAVLAAPFLFRKLGLVSGIASTQFATAIILACLATTSGAAGAAVVYVGYTGLLWMTEPGLFSLVMSRVAPGEQAGASAMNFLVISSAQAIAVATAGASFARYGYPTVLGAMAAVALAAALFFRLILGKDVLPPPQPSPATFSPQVPLA
jgi:hypothetical protein